MAIETGGCALEVTCGACPEAYDVFIDDEYVGYMRLRHGHFRAEYMFEEDSETVFTASPEGDGVFESEERQGFLEKAAKALHKRHKSNGVVDIQEISTILAALRFYQDSGMGEPLNRSEPIHEIATNGGECISLDEVAIDALCEKINLEGLTWQS